MFNKHTVIIASLLTVITFFHYFLFSHQLVFHDLVRILYYLPIIYGAFVYKLKGGVIISSLVVVLYAPHLLLYFGQIDLVIIYQLLELLMFVVIGLGAGYLVERDYLKRQSIEQQVIKITNLENYNHNILDSLDSGVIAFDNRGNVKFVNKVVKKEFVSSDSIEKIFKKLSIKQSILEILNGEKSNSSEEINYMNEVYQISCSPLRTITNAINGVVVIVNKITTLKVLEEQVRRGERLAAVGTLAAGIAHEIRNPLGIIKTICQTIQHDDINQFEDDNLIEGLQIIDHEINRANEVVKWLLDFAKHDQYVLENINLSNMVNQLTTIFNKYSEKKLVHIELDVETNIWIHGDMEKLKQALVNIMLNGIQSIEGKGNLKVSLSSMENKAILIFEDTGCGIKKELLDKIFNPFFTTKDKGTGLGLPITFKIIEQHKGSLTIESEETKGTKVTVELPKILGVQDEE